MIIYNGNINNYYNGNLFRESWKLLLMLAKKNLLGQTNEIFPLPNILVQISYHNLFSKIHMYIYIS